jgi:REP element-mobilizing transposase RayT
MGRRGRRLFDNQGHMYFITNTVLDFENVFNIGDSYYDIVIDTLKYQLDQHQSSLYAYVLMPNHFHLILHFPFGESISDFMRDLKRYTSISTRRQLEEDGQFEFINKLMQKSGHGGFKLWMDRFDDVILYTDKVIQSKVDYIHNNPVKAGLVNSVTDWKYSSARNYFLDDHSVIRIGKWEPSVQSQVNT